LKATAIVAVAFVFWCRAFCGIEIPEKTELGAVYVWASWGAAVLRPYMSLLGGAN
jgi:hypothetical protein